MRDANWYFKEIDTIEALIKNMDDAKSKQGLEIYLDHLHDDLADYEDDED
ncbi:hypothetical protein [Priestia flexa]|nr:hypothetical protein [Priestia flexa]